MELLVAHLRAAYGAEGAAIVKGDAYYAERISEMTGGERQQLMHNLGEQGFSLEFVDAPLGGESIRIRCVEPAAAKRLIEDYARVMEGGR